MVKSLAKILFVILPVMVNGQEALSDRTLTPTDTHLLDSLALAQANDKIARLTEEVESLKVKAGIQEREYNKLQEKMQSVLQVVMPFAEAGIKAQMIGNTTDFFNVDFATLKKQSNTLQQLAPYSKALKARYDTIALFQNLIVEYTKCYNFDKKSYSDSLVNATENQLLDLYDKGENILNKLQQNQIDSLYAKVGNYRAAVEAFNSLIKDVDKKIDVYRENEKASSLATEDFNAVIETSGEKIAQIKRYRYLAELYHKYTKELAESPRSRTEVVRDEIAEMLGIGPTPDSEINANDVTTE